jgi:hypothetical protein
VFEKSERFMAVPGFMVSVPIQHLCVKIDLADEPTTAAMRIRAFPAIHKNVEGAQQAQKDACLISIGCA